MENKKTFDTIDILVFLWKKRISIIIITVIGAIVSIIISLLMPNYYRATTVLFPTTFISPATAIVNYINQETDPLIIGNEDDLEKIIQILQSDYITQKIIEKYNLINHYEISPTDPNFVTKVKKQYNSNVNFNKTQYQGVIITVTDTDPLYSANIANDIAFYLDTLIFEMQKQRAVEALNITNVMYKYQYNHLKKLEDSLDMFRQYGVLDYFTEVDRYSEAYGKAIGNNTLTPNGQKFFNEKFSLLKEYGKEYYSLTGMINSLISQVISLEVTILALEQNIKNPMTHKFIISYAQPPDKKSKPKRSFIVLFSTIGAFAFAIAYALFIDFFIELKQKIKKIETV